MLSARGRRALHDPNPLVAAHFAAKANPWSPENSGGIINLGTAENHLLADIIDPAIAAAELGDHHYVELHGTDAARGALAGFHGHMKGDNLALVAGVSSALDIVATNCFQRGDLVIVPAPHYPGFLHCLEGRAGLNVESAQMGPSYELDTSQFNPKAKGLFLCSPHNPLGHVYDEAKLREVLDWCHDHDVLLVSDEIYLHSVFEGRGTSLLELDENVVTLYGLAKDVGLSGWKMGGIHTTDEQLLEACRELAYFAPVSSPTQAMAAALLPAMGDQIKSANKERLAEAYASVHLKHEPAQAGLFAWIDLRDGLPDSTWAGEAKLHQQILEAGVLLSPGSNFGAHEPGWFRMCFAVDAQTRAEAQARIARLLR